MKRIIFLLLTVFSFLGHQAIAQQIGIVTGSAIGNVGDVVNIPVNVILPQGSQLFESCQGAIISTDPSVAIIVGATSNVVSTAIVNGEACNFINGSGSINMPNSVLLTLQVQIVGLGCADFTLSEIVGEPSSAFVEFVVDGIFYDDLATDFNVNEGTVCGVGCSCDINNLTLGPIDYAVNPNDCSTTKVNIPPVLGCENVEVSFSYNYKVYLAGSLLYELNTTADGFIFPFTEDVMYTIVITYTILDDSGCTQQVTLSEDYTHQGCDCSCDISNLTLGPIDYTVNQNDCSTTIVNIPPVLGCDDVDVSFSYNYKVYLAGSLLYELTTTADGFIFPFTFGAAYTIVITYTIVDDSGCTQQITLSENYIHGGCGCQFLGPPTFLDCQPGINPKATFHTLFWTPVLGASSYEIEFTYNDPLCCKTTLAPYSVIVSKTSTSMSVTNGTCYSWRVRSVCSDGSKSAWSNKDCSCSPSIYEMVPDTLSGDGGKSLTEFDNLLEDGRLNLQAVPNPATNHVDITLTGLSSEIALIQPEIIIYDMTGKVIYRSEVTLDEVKRVDLSSFKSGIYFIKAVDTDTILSVEKLVIQ